MQKFRLFYYLHIERENSTEICYQHPEHVGDFDTLEMAQDRAAGHFKERCKYMMPDDWYHHDNFWRLLIRYVNPGVVTSTAYEITEWDYA